MSADEGDIIFTGGSAEEAEDFIFDIKKRAYSKGKLKDNTWITEFVSVCFAKKALRWYERLDPETRNDWKLLKRAILDEYEETSLAPTPASTRQGPVLKTVPAAGPLIRTGRIRVHSEFDQLRGYISNTHFVFSHWCCVSADKSVAAIFEFDALAHTIKYQGKTDEYLIARVSQKDWELQKGSFHWASLSKNQGQTAAPISGWSDNIQAGLWSVRDEDSCKLVGRWPLKAGGFGEVEGTSYVADKRVYLSLDPQAFLQKFGGNYKSLTLYFEALT